MDWAEVMVAEAMAVEVMVAEAMAEAERVAVAKAGVDMAAVVKEEGMVEVVTAGVMVVEGLVVAMEAEEKEEVGLVEVEMGLGVRAVEGSVEVGWVEEARVGVG